MKNLYCNKNKSVCVLFSSTANLLFAIGSVIAGIEKFSQNFVSTYIILLDSLDDRASMYAIDKISKNKCIYKKYNPEDVGLNQPSSSNISIYSGMCFGIYELFNYIKEFDYVLYLDPDLLVRDDIEGMLSRDYVRMTGGRLTIREAIGNNDVPPNISSYTAKNSGVVLLNADLLAITDIEKLYHDCILYTNKFWNTLVFPDQAILNYVLRANNIPINDFSIKYNCSIKSRTSFFDKVIIHATGSKSKFWNNGVTNLMFSDWNAFYNKFIRLGGVPYSGKKYYWSLSFFSQKDLFDAVKFANNSGFDISIVNK